MATFPAYAAPETKREETDSSNKDWLQCSSFIPVQNQPEIEVNLKRKNKKKKHRNKELKRDEDSAEKMYEIDVTPVPQVKLKAPIQQSSHSNVDKTKKKRRKKRVKLQPKDRYFSEELPRLPDPEKIDVETFLEMTKEFNVLLRENPKDIESWCKYISLQDKGEGTKNGIASKKLSILEKALEKNSSSDVLLTMKLSLMEELYPYDKVVSEAKMLASKHASSKIGWRWLISSTQFNLTRLTVPGLISHFGAMLEDSTKRGGQPKFILDVLLEVGLFLRQAGLWELLWTLVEQYLEICFTVIGSGAFKVSVELPEKEIENVEDGIMTSGLPLHALWIRTEHLRSCVHFLPSNVETGDHQRLVLPEDVGPLMYPITPDLSTRLAGIALILLKVPPLPCTEAFVTYLGLKNIPWHLESSEVLLTAMLPGGVSHGDVSYLNELKELLVPPQYIKENLGSDVFLEAVEKMFNLIAEHCHQDRINFLVWEIRWWRYCVVTKSLRGIAAKPFLSKAKSILKKERTALPIYTEYALLEEAVGNVDAALKVLETAISSVEPGLLAGKKDQRYIFACYRTYAEVLLRNQPADYKEKLYNLMVATAYGEKLIKVTNIQSDTIQKAYARFEHVSSEMLNQLEDSESHSLEDVIIGHPDLHWLSCHGWFSFVLLGRLPQFLIEDHAVTRNELFSEGLAQLKIDILRRLRDSENSFDNSKFVDVVTTACSKYPNNTNILHALSTVKCHGLKWSKISSYLVLSGSQIAVMFLALLSKLRLFSGDTTQIGSVNKMFSILTTCTKCKELERCPMLWRLILQYVSCTLDEDVAEKEYHKAVEKCPWVKILYYEAAHQLPKLLADVQDLLTEKELRIHVTPEELEILREPAPEAESHNEDNPATLSGETTENVVEQVESWENASLSGNSASVSSGLDCKVGDGLGSERVSRSGQVSDVVHLPESGQVCGSGQDSEFLNVSGSGQVSGSADLYDPENSSDSSIDSDTSDSEIDSQTKQPQTLQQNLEWEAKRHQIAAELWESSCSTATDGDTQTSIIPNLKEQSSIWEATKTADEPPAVSEWDKERLKKAKQLWEAKRAAKRKLNETDERQTADDPTNSTEYQLRNKMEKLEEEEIAKLAEDTCKDDETAITYDDTEWNKDKLKIMRDLWESKRKK